MNPVTMTILNSKIDIGRTFNSTERSTDSSPDPYSATKLVLFISVYLSSLPVAHPSDARRRQLVVTGDSARIQDETTKSSAWFFNVLGV